MVFLVYEGDYSVCCVDLYVSPFAAWFPTFVLALISYRKTP